MSFRLAYGNAYSENGWRMVNVDGCSLPLVNLDYLNAAWIRDGDPLVILSAWLKYYDDNIAPIVSTVWGWSRENTVSTSNHLSGTALDINAPQWPWGQRRMPADLKARIRKGLDLFQGTVFWGADWSYADEMHFQMAFPEGDKRNSAFAARLRSGYLGIYGDGEDDDMPSAAEVAAAVWGHKVPKPDGTTGEAGHLLGWVDQHTGDTLDQLAGAGSKDQRTGTKGPLKPTGWPQMADDERAVAPKPSLVDGTASRADLARVEAKIDRLLAQLDSPGQDV